VFTGDASFEAYACGFERKASQIGTLKHTVSREVLLFSITCSKHLLVLDNAFPEIDGGKKAGISPTCKWLLSYKTRA